MVYVLRHWGYLDATDILNACVFHLLYEHGKSLRKSEPESIARNYNFTDEQSKVIAQFLRFVEGDELAVAERQAVEKWEKYAQGLGSGNDNVSG